MVNKTESEFKCLNCGSLVPINVAMGTVHRNHCNRCLWSVHLDKNIPGDRQSNCKSLMNPIGLTFKKNLDKHGKEKLGDIMLVHYCNGCEAIRANRIAADDFEELILKVLDNSADLKSELKAQLYKQGIYLTTGDQKQLVLNGLFGTKSIDK